MGVEPAATPQYLKLARSCVVAVSHPASQRHSQRGTAVPCPEQSGGPKGQVRAWGGVGAGVGLWRRSFVLEERGREEEEEGVRRKRRKRARQSVKKSKRKKSERLSPARKGRWPRGSPP